MNNIPEVCDTPGCNERPVMAVDWHGITYNCHEHAWGIERIARHLQEYPKLTPIKDIRTDEEDEEQTT